METSKNNTGLIILLVIFIMISLFLGGFIVYDKFTTKDESKEVTTEDKTTKEDNNVVSNDSYQVLGLAPIGGYAVVYKNEVYVNVYDTTSNIDAVYGTNKYQTLIKTRNNYQEYSFGNLKISSGAADELNKWLKLNISNVESIYNNEYGQALSEVNPKYGLILITTSKEVYYISIDSLISGNATPVKLNYSNVQKVVTETTYAYTTYLVNSNGEKTDINALIK